jgi:hypothetical protein
VLGVEIQPFRLGKHLDTWLQAECAESKGNARNQHLAPSVVSFYPPVIFRKVIEIASKRRRILSEMRTAIHVGDKEAVFNLAKKLTGLSDETGYRAD